MNKKEDMSLGAKVILAFFLFLILYAFASGFYEIFNDLTALYKEGNWETLAIKTTFATFIFWYFFKK